MRKIIVAAAVASVLSIPAAGPAQAAPPSSTTVRDGTQTGGREDVTTVKLAAARGGGQAVITIRFAAAQATNDGLVVWLNLDRDPAPDIRLTAYYLSEFFTQGVTTWEGRGRNIAGLRCFEVDTGTPRLARVSFDPDCLGRSTRMQVSVAGVSSGPDGVELDHAPGKHRWSKAVRSRR